MSDELTDEDMIEAAKAFGYDMRWARFCQKVKTTRGRLEKALSIMERVRKILHGTKWGKHGGAFDSGCPICLINRVLETPSLPLPEMAQLDALSPTWSAAKPMVAGRYWLRARRYHVDDLIVELIAGTPSLQIRCPGSMFNGLMVHELADGQFAGPLVLPREAGQ